MMCKEAAQFDAKISAQMANLTPSMIFLVVLYSCSVFLSLSVLLFLLSIGIQTRSGKLTFFLNTSFFFVTFTKFPILMVQSSVACTLAGYIYWYFNTFGLLVLYDLVGAVNLRMLATDHLSRTISRSSEYQLQNLNLFYLLFLPTLTLVIPLSCGSFTRTENYCQIDRESRKGLISRSAYLLITLILQIIILRKLYQTCQFLKQTFSETSYRHLLWKLMTGPGAYPLYLVIATIVADIFILATYLSSTHIQDANHEQSDYSFEVLQAILGLIAALIFFVFERNEIQAFELHYKEMKDFEVMIGRSSESFVAEKEMPALSIVSRPSGFCPPSDNYHESLLCDKSLLSSKS